MQVEESETVESDCFNDYNKILEITLNLDVNVTKF